MSDNAGERVTRILEQVQAGDVQMTDELLPLVYAELRRLARVRMEKRGAG